MGEVVTRNTLTEEEDKATTAAGNKAFYKISREKFEPEPGFEPRTSGFLARRSTTWAILVLMPTHVQISQGTSNEFGFQLIISFKAFYANKYFYKINSIITEKSEVIWSCL